MQTVADMRGLGVKYRGKYADVLCKRAPYIEMNCDGQVFYESDVTFPA
jgi:hypothetical protein